MNIEKSSKEDLCRNIMANNKQSEDLYCCEEKEKVAAPMVNRLLRDVTALSAIMVYCVSEHFNRGRRTKGVCIKGCR